MKFFRRQALEGAAVAPGTDHTLHLLTDIERRPPNRVRELMWEFVLEVPFALDEKSFCSESEDITQGCCTRSVCNDFGTSPTPAVQTRRFCTGSSEVHVPKNRHEQQIGQGFFLEDGSQRLEPKTV